MIVFRTISLLALGETLGPINPRALPSQLMSASLTLLLKVALRYCGFRSPRRAAQ